MIFAFSGRLLRIYWTKVPHHWTKLVAVLNSQDRFKLLYWDGEGFWLMYKRFENGKLNWPRKEHVLREMTFEQVEWLLKGFSIDLPIQQAKQRVIF